MLRYRPPKSIDHLENAVRTGRHNKIRRLSCKYNNKDYFRYAVRTNINTVKVLLEKTNIKPIDSSCLLYAITRKNSPGKFIMLEYLLDNLKLDPNDHPDFLFKIKDIDTLLVLVKYGTNINIHNTKRYDHQPLLFHMLDICKINIDNLNKLFSVGFDLNALDNKSNNIIHYVFYTDYNYQNYPNKQDKFNSYLDYIFKNVDNDLINRKNDENMLPIDFLINSFYRHCKLRIINYIIYHNLGNITHVKEDGQNIFSIFDQSIMSAEDINRDKNYMLETIAKLLDAGVDPNQINNYGKSVIYHAPKFIKEFIQNYNIIDIKDPGYD
jgi:hypothetical protein